MEITEIEKNNAQSNDQSQNVILKGIDKIYEAVISGSVPGTASASELAEQYEAGHTFILDCLYINDKSIYGDAPVCGVADAKGSFMVNLPKHLLAQVNEMLKDEEAVQAIQLGRAGFRIRQYQPKGSTRICYTVDWVDVDLPGDLPF